MSREIKFRAWLLDDYGQPMREMRYCQNFKECYSIQENWSNLTPFMQYTGRKDKNGMEIYEGDIVTALLDDLSENGIVRFYNGTFSIKHNCPHRMFTPLSYFNSTDVEIIGNIYENPEFLKEMHDE